MAYIRPEARIIAAVIAGESADMDRAADRVLSAVRRAATPRRNTGAYIRNLKVVSVPGMLGTGRQVRDRLVVADDPGAAAIEWGHLVRVPGARRVRWVPGTHVMRKGMMTA